MRSVLSALAEKIHNCRLYRASTPSRAPRRGAVCGEGQEPRAAGPELPGERSAGAPDPRDGGPRGGPGRDRDRDRSRGAVAGIVDDPAAPSHLQRPAQGRQELPVREDQRAGGGATPLGDAPDPQRRGALPGAVYRRQTPAPDAARDPTHLPGADLPRFRGSPAHEPAVPVFPHSPLRRPVHDARARGRHGVPRASSTA